MSKKLKVKDIKRDAVHDRLAVAATWIVDTWRRHARTILVAAGAVVVVAVAWTIFAWTSHRAELRAHAALADALDLVEKASDDAGWNVALTALRDVASRRAARDCRLVARLHEGDALARAGRHAEAMNALSDLAQRHPRRWVAPAALMRLASVQEETGDVAAAEATLRRVQDGAWVAFPNQSATLALAELHERNGRGDEARRLYEQLTEDDSRADSALAAVARDRLERLPPPPAS